MDRKKIKLLIALNGWKIRCRMVWHNDGYVIRDMYYAWFEDSEGNNVSHSMSQKFHTETIRDTRTQAINSLIDTWYELNKHELVE
jgi:hypothetical protein